MKRNVSKSLCFAFTCLLFFTILCQRTTAAEAPVPKIKFAPLNPAYVEYATGQKQTRAARSIQPERKNYGSVPAQVDWSHLNGVSISLPETENNATAAHFAVNAALPSAFDLRSQMPPVRSQGDFGTCWAFAAMAPIESNLIRQGLAQKDEIDLSEWHLSYYAYNDETAALTAFPLTTPNTPYYDHGGADWTAAAILTRGTGPIYESQAPYPDDSGDIYVPPLTPSDYKLTDMLYLAIEGEYDVSLDKNRMELVKNALMEYGALSVELLVVEDETEYKRSYNSTTAAYYCLNDGSEANHAVTLVGWDDNYAKENFGGKDGDGYYPEEDGAWIIRNSWDDDWGDEGYYYFSYEDKSLKEGIAYLTVPAVKNEKIYQYDPLGFCRFIAPAEEEDDGEEGATAYFANLFTAERHELLTSVALYVPAPDTEYEITVYANCTDTPTDGTKTVTQNETVTAPGYRTVKLTQPVPVLKGQKFSVVVKAKTTSYEYPVPTGFQPKTNAERGRSFLSTDGAAWFDLRDFPEDGLPPLNEDYELIRETGNYTLTTCLKAFATPIGGDGSSSGCTVFPTAAFLLALVAVPVLIRRNR